MYDESKKMKTAGRLAVVVLAIALAVPGLCQGGRYAIVRPADASLPHAFAAEELQLHLKLVEVHRSFGAPLYDYIMELGPIVKDRFPEAVIHFLVYRKEQTQRPPVGFGKWPDNFAAMFAPIDDDRFEIWLSLKLDEKGGLLCDRGIFIKVDGP